MARWRRVKTPRSFFLITGGMIIAGPLFLVLVAVEAVRHPFGPGAFAAAVGFVSLWTAAAVRVNRMGVYYGDHGVRTRSLLWTRTVPWVSVEAFEDRPAPHNPWARGSPVPSRAVWILRWDGTAIQTPLAYQTTRFFMDGSSDIGERRFTWRWSEPECRAALTQLNQVLARARLGLAREAAPHRPGRKRPA